MRVTLVLAAAIGVCVVGALLWNAPSPAPATTPTQMSASTSRLLMSAPTFGLASTTASAPATLATMPRQLELIVHKGPGVQDLPPSVTWHLQTVTLNDVLKTVNLSANVQAGAPVQWAAFSSRDDLYALETLFPLPASAAAGPWSIAVFLLTNDEYHDWGLTSPSRSVVGLFTKEMSSDVDVMRTLLHELGHALNLFHNDGDALNQCCELLSTGLNTGRSLMNQRSCLDPQHWGFTFCQTEQKHLLTHSIASVMPGSGRRLGDCEEPTHQRICQ